MAEKIRFSNIYSPGAVRVRTLSNTGITNGQYNALSDFTASKFGTLHHIPTSQTAFNYFAQHGARVTLENRNVGVLDLIVPTSTVIFDFWDSDTNSYVECHIEEGVDSSNKPYLQWVDSNGSNVNNTYGNNARITGNKTSSVFLVAPIHVGFRLNLENNCYDAILAMYISDSDVLDYDYKFDTHGSFMCGSRMAFRTGRNYKRFMPLSGCVKISENIAGSTLVDPIAVRHYVTKGTNVIIP